MSKRLSIVERMRKAKSLDLRRTIALEWAEGWRREHAEIMARLHVALGDDRRVGPILGEMQGMSAKKLEGLANVIKALSDEDVEISSSHRPNQPAPLSGRSGP